MSWYLPEKNAFPASSWSATDAPAWQYDGLNASLLQYVHPPRPFVPSRLGQVNPASNMTFCTLNGKKRRRKPLKSVYK